MDLIATLGRTLGTSGGILEVDAARDLAGRICFKDREAQLRAVREG